MQHVLMASEAQNAKLTTNKNHAQKKMTLLQLTLKVSQISWFCNGTALLLQVSQRLKELGGGGGGVSARDVCDMIETSCYHMLAYPSSK